MESIEDSPYASLFYQGDANLAYLDGNSLGRMPCDVPERMRQVLEQQWGDQLIRSWNQHWLGLQNHLSRMLAELVGAGEDEVLVSDSTSINLYKLASAACQLDQSRSKILTDSLQFPSDLYILESIGSRLDPSVDHASNQSEYLDSKVEGCRRIAMSDPPTEEDIDRLIGAIDEQTAIVCLSHVLYRSGYLYDLPRITHEAHRKGAMVLWDLSHSVGAVPIELSKDRVDLAVGCTYKYLNGGPGSPAFLYVRKDLQSKLENPIAGWFSCQKPFDFSSRYKASDHVSRFSVGTPPILSMVAMSSGLEIASRAGIDWIRGRSLRLTEYLIKRATHDLLPLGFRLTTPRESERRGSHVSIDHPSGWQIAQALIDRHHVLPDFRPPATIRLGVAALYTSKRELDQAVDALVECVTSQSYRTYPEQLDRVP